MSSEATTVYRELAKLLGDELAADEILVSSVSLSAEKFGDDATVTRLRFLGDLKEVLGSQAQLYAVGLLMSLPRVDSDWRTTLAEHKLNALESDLTYVKPIVVEENTFRRAKDLWKEEIERLTLAPDHVQLLYMATLVTRILKRDWNNFLQQQQLVDRAKLAAVILGENSDAVATWVRLLETASKASYRDSAPKRGELSFSLN